jgi:hypothetical protein
VVSKENGLKNGTWGCASPSFYHGAKLAWPIVAVTTVMDVIMIASGFFYVYWGRCNH